MSRPPASAAASAAPVAVPRDTSDIAAARTLVRALDGWQLDPIIGLFVPGLGDIITAVVGGFLIIVAGRHRLPPIVIARMLLNLGIDTAIGAVPLVGDVGDFLYRANNKNLALLEQRAGAGGKGSWRDWAAVIGAGALLVAAIALVVWIFIRVLTAIF
jgi:hypothetical protein